MEENAPKPKKTYYILSKISQDPVRDFQELLLELKETWVISVIQNSDRQASLSNNMGYSSDISLASENVLEGQDFPFAVKLMIHPEDQVTFNAIRRALWHSHVEYKLYSQSYRCFIPKDPDLVIDEVGEQNKETHKSLAQFNLKPVYYYQKTRVYYAVTPTGSVVIINPFLLGFLLHKEIPESTLEELSYEVSSDMKIFSGKFEKGLIPTDFYEYYKKNFKIINNSHFDITNPGRKVFIKPLIFEYNSDSFDFYTYAGDNTSSLLLMDKIRPGETLDQTLRRVLRDELKISEDYIGAVVPNYVEFDRDKEGVITPRLIVEVYVEKIKNKEWAQKMSQTSWKSLNGNFASPQNNI